MSIARLRVASAREQFDAQVARLLVGKQDEAAPASGGAGFPGVGPTLAVVRDEHAEAGGRTGFVPVDHEAAIIDRTAEVELEPRIDGFRAHTPRAGRIRVEDGAGILASRGPDLRLERAQIGGLARLDLEFVDPDRSAHPCRR